MFDLNPEKGWTPAPKGTDQRKEQQAECRLVNSAGTCPCTGNCPFLEEILRHGKDRPTET